MKDGPLSAKFDVMRKDGSDAFGKKHHGCEYFVLDLTHDQYALPALTAYATACICGDHPMLGIELKARIRALEEQADKERTTP
jgi:hypothetical protein